MALKDWKKHTGLWNYYYRGAGKNASVVQQYVVISVPAPKGGAHVVEMTIRGRRYLKYFKTEEEATVFMKNYLRLH